MTLDEKQIQMIIAEYQTGEQNDSVVCVDFDPVKIYTVKLGYTDQDGAGRIHCYFNKCPLNEEVYGFDNMNLFDQIKSIGHTITIKRYFLPEVIEAKYKNRAIALANNKASKVSVIQPFTNETRYRQRIMKGQRWSHNETCIAWFYTTERFDHV